MAPGKRTTRKEVLQGRRRINRRIRQSRKFVNRGVTRSYEKERRVSWGKRQVAGSPGFRNLGDDVSYHIRLVRASQPSSGWSRYHQELEERYGATCGSRRQPLEPGRSDE